MYEQILYDVDDAVATISMNRPRYRNAQSRVMREELDDAFSTAEQDAAVAVIVLTGEGADFSSGHDLGTAEERADAEARPFAPGAQGVVERAWALNVENALRWRELTKPTIAAVRGNCIYGGCILASVMDFIIASDTARFLFGYVQLFTAPWDLGVRRARQVLFENRFIDAAEALGMGYVNEVVPDDQLDSRVCEVARTIARNDPLFLRFVKQSTIDAEDAMGWRQAVRAAHGNFLGLQLSGGLDREGDALNVVQRAKRQDAGDPV